MLPLIDPDTIMASQAGSAIGRRVIVFRETASTNDVAIALGNSPEPEGTVVIALSQTAGRGQFGRNWHSAPGLGLWLSILLRPTWPSCDLPQLTPLTAVAIANALTRATDQKFRIKPPNDLYLADRKVAGILTEAKSGKSPFAVVGIGINVNQSESDFPPGLATIATSLALATNRTFSLESVAIDVLSNLNLFYPTSNPHDSKILSSYSNLCNPESLNRASGDAPNPGRHTR